MPLDAAQLGHEQTMRELTRLLAEKFEVQVSPDLAPDEPLFAVGSGLSSLEGIEFLCVVEKEFGLSIKDLEWWVYETPTLSAVAQYVIDLAKQQRPLASG